jgi:formylglycine-generating enzyme required for sulfatase activity
VTKDAYFSWMQTAPSTSGQPSSCAFNSSFSPSCDYPPTPGDQHPVECVDWCDAYAYCAAHGRRLCGNRSGGPNYFGDYANPNASQWYYACTSGSVDAFPYGSTYQSNRCNGADAGFGASVTVGSLTMCHSSNPSFSAYYDLSGNVGEWEDSCDASIDGNDACRIRGGDWASGQAAIRCDADTFALRSFKAIGTGFRCCAL